MLSQKEIEEFGCRVTPQWMAGFFDGEGTIGVMSRKVGLPPSVYVRVTQKDPFVMKAIADAFPGSAGVNVNHWGVTGSNCFCVSWHGIHTIPLLEAIKDFVVVKRRGVEAGLKLARLVKPRGFNYNSPVTPQERSEREKLADEIQSFNDENRGPGMSESFAVSVDRGDYLASLKKETQMSILAEKIVGSGVPIKDVLELLRRRASAGDKT